MNNDTCADGTPTTRSGTKRGAIGIYPELKGMFDSKNQYQNCGTVGISKLLRLFDCENIKVDRKGGLTMLIQDPFCNILGDLQTSMLRPTFGSEIFMSNGLNQRFLFCVAEDIEYPERSHATLPSDTSLQWEQTVKTLYEGIYHDIRGNHYTLFRSNDGIVSLGDDADRFYNEYYNGLQHKKAVAATDYESAIYSKLQIQCLRYAGIVHALEVAEEKGMRDDYNIMHGNTMEYAIRCMDYFEKMALLVYKKIAEPSLSTVQPMTTKADVIRSFLTCYPNVSQNALASLIGCSAAYISKIINQKQG